MLRAHQAVFSNVSIYDDAFLDAMLLDYIFPDGNTPNKETVKEIQRIFLSTMNSEMSRTVYTFPVVTACFAKDKETGELIKGDLFDELPKYAMKYSFVNIYTGDTATLSSCCRLRSDTTNEYFNSFGAGSAKIGSVGVVTINLPRLAEKCKSDKDKFIDDIKYFTNVCAKVNNAKRHIVRKKIENGNHPLYTLGFADLSRQYSTVGMNGIYEAIEYLGMDITTNAGAEYLLKVLDTVNKTNDMNSKRYTSPHNCEQVPKMCGDVKSYLIDLECHENMVDKGQARQFINVCAA